MEIYLCEATYGEILEEGKDGLIALRENQKLFILGKPGSGKTTFLKYIVIEAIDNLPFA